MELLQGASREPPRRAGRHDHRARHGRHRGRGDQAGRLRLHHQAVRAGRDPAGRRQGAAKTHASAAKRSRRRADGQAARFGIIGESPQIQEVYTVIDKVADTPVDRAHHRRERHRQGAGRPRAARAARRAATSRSSRSTAPRSPRTLMESELFGYERGAFTGAVAAQAGPLRAGRRRHAVPRRDRRDPGRDAGEAAARAAGERVRARRRHQDHPGRRAPRRRDQPRPASRRSRPGASARTSTTG